jgi:hexosaminidase
MAEINDIFPDPIFHFGGDEVSLTCLKNATEAKKDMQQYNVGGNFELYFRKRQHKIMMGINPSKTPMYWMNSGQMSIESQDVIHWWGGGFPDTTNKVVISNYGPYYLDMGVGNYYGVGYGSYINWLDFYNRNLKNEIQGYRNKDNVLGAEACLWSEISNQFTHHLKIWMRTSSLAERLWNSKIRVIKPGVLRRLAKQERLMNRKGIATAPVTCQQC